MAHTFRTWRATPFDRGQRAQNGQLQTALAAGRFLFARVGGRTGGQALEIVTPDFDCSQRHNVHVALHSLYQQEESGLGAIEYSVDAGVSWLPVAYLIEPTRIVRDASGEINVLKTLQQSRVNAPTICSDHAELNNRDFAVFLRAPLTPDLNRAVFSRRGRDAADSKRLEVYHLPRADGQSQVRLRMILAGSSNSYWGVDDFGLYEISTDPREQPPAVLAPAEEPAMLAGLALAIRRRAAAGDGLRGAISPRTSCPCEVRKTACSQCLLTG